MFFRTGEHPRDGAALVRKNVSFDVGASAPPTLPISDGKPAPEARRLWRLRIYSYLFLQRSRRCRSYARMLNRAERQHQYPPHVVSPTPSRRPAPACAGAGLTGRRSRTSWPTGGAGRGAQTNISGRYEPKIVEAFDDEWGSLEELPPLKTEVQIERARKIITRNQSPDISFDRSINPYRGCEHGCAYCFARPTHANMGLSPGLDFESKLFVKPDAAKLLEKELAAARLRAAHHRDRHQHRSLSADRARVARHAADPRGAVEGAITRSAS